MILPTVKVIDVHKNFSNKKVLENITFEVFPSEVFVLLGPNGAGKTTTVKILTGILEPDIGEVFIFNKKMSVLNTEVKQHIGYLPDEPYIYPKLTGKEFLEFVLSLYKKDNTDDLYNYLLSEFQLENAITAQIDTYSKGMKQKLLLMSIFLREPDLYILDEPLIGLDPSSINFLKRQIIELRSKGKTVILCTHLLELAEQLSTKLAIIYNGKILQYGTKQQIKENLLVSSDSLEDIYIKAVNSK
ncbi:MAG: ABC transporter ATP-binding protein [Endomicrobia bacterium]|nr:ABC transporter ATP-binding protein [Endomicrobiia bacterium]